VSKYEKELEDVRDQINDVKPSDPIAWLPNPKTIESESLILYYSIVNIIFSKTSKWYMYSYSR